MKSIYRSIDNSMHEQIKSLGSKTIVDAALHLNDELRVIPCSNPHSWEDGKEYEEGKDYEVASRANGFFVKGSYSNKCVYCGNVFHNTDKLWFCCEDCSNQMIVSPLLSNDEDELLAILERNYQTQIALFYNDDKTERT